MSAEGGDECTASRPPSIGKRVPPVLPSHEPFSPPEKGAVIVCDHGTHPLKDGDKVEQCTHTEACRGRILLVQSWNRW